MASTPKSTKSTKGPGSRSKKSSSNKRGTSTDNKELYFLYDTSNDFNIDDRKARLVQTKKRLRSHLGVKKNACLKYIPKKGKKQWRRVIVGQHGKPIYYLSVGRLGGKDSLDGEAYKICKPEKTDVSVGKSGLLKAWCNLSKSYVLAVKVIPLTVEEAAHLYNNSYRTWKEIKILREVTQIFNRGISPNLPVYYTSVICNNSKVEDYQNKNIINYFKNGEKIERMAELIEEINEIRKQLSGLKYYKDIKKKIDGIYRRTLKEFLKNDIKPEKHYSDKSVLIFNEIADYDVTHLLENNPEFVLRREYIMPTIFQILHGLAAVQQELEIVHFDLHLSNVLVTKVIPGDFWHYKVGGTDYYIPNQGFLFKIWDFGRSSYLHKDKPEIIKKKILRQFDRFFRFNAPDFSKKLDKTFKKAAFRKYLYSFDVFRFFSAYHAKLMQSISDLSKSKTSFTSKGLSTFIPTLPTDSSEDTGRVTKPLNSLSTRQINKLPELEILKKISDYAFEDIMYYLVSPRIKKHGYRGGPQMLIKKYFKDYTSEPENPKKTVINYGSPFTL